MVLGQLFTQLNTILRTSNKHTVGEDVLFILQRVFLKQLPLAPRRRVHRSHLRGKRCESLMETQGQYETWVVGLLTKRGYKMFVGIQGLHAALVLVVPDPQGLVVRAGHYEFASGVDKHPTHPVVMTDLQQKGVMSQSLHLIENSRETV